LFGGVMLMILVSSAAPFRETTTLIFASPAQIHVTSVGQRESSRTSLKVRRVSVPFTDTVCPTGSANETPGSAMIAVSTGAHPGSEKSRQPVTNAETVERRKTLA
jgi:hypothetical protein